MTETEIRKRVDSVVFTHKCFRRSLDQAIEAMQVTFDEEADMQLVVRIAKELWEQED